MLKPIDIVVLARILVEEDPAWTQMELATRLGVSQSAIHRSLGQLERSGLWRDRTPQRTAFRELAKHGIRYVYPAELGPPARGLPTAHAGPGTASDLLSNQIYVWPLDTADGYGTSIEPLHPVVPSAAAGHRRFYELMALLDVFRTGRARDQTVAAPRLDQLLGLEP